MVLEKCFAVTTVEDAAQASALLRERPFDLVLLCSTFSDRDTRRILATVHGLPRKTKVLALWYGTSRIQLKAPDEELFSPGPAALMHKAREMIGADADACEEQPVRVKGTE